MARTVECSQRSALGGKRLAVSDISPVFIAIGVVLEDLCVWAVRQKIRNAMHVVWVPMREQCLVDCDVVLAQRRFDRFDPCFLPFAGIYQQTLGACADDVCVCALQRELLVC